MWDASMFITFSVVESFAAFVLTLTIFRLKALDFQWQALVVSLLMSCQSFVLREELDLAFLAPVINILLMVLLITTVVKVPLIWSGILSVTGFFVYTLVQTILLVLMYSDVPMSELQGGTAMGSLLQAITSAVVLIASGLLYKFGIGFIAPFDKLRFKWEQNLVVVVIIGALVTVTVIAYLNDVWLNIAYFAMAAGLFLYYALKKEREYD
ncbi:hypothetical protein C1I60_14060 [Paenibacillus terrae]|uniref:Uncharacterized protein n=1 Tax=Paenibacillus terrae TaxID=159743 RepID=A0A4U2Q269_9BACL|nr:hypothetical protein [Paenibacillus terrae]TKH43418.1 hypothetical protein C1I60_14060 [Paenibacillus terrae]